MAKQEFHIRITLDNKTAVDYLADASGISRQKLKQAMQKGCVWLERFKPIVTEDKTILATTELAVTEASDVLDAIDVSNKDNNIEQVTTTKQSKQTQPAYIQRLRRAKKVVNKNDILHFYYDESILSNELEPAILVEDFGDYSIWNKPSGMLSQGSKWGDHCTTYRWAEKNLQPERPAFIVHRLDRAANGLIILAHKKSIASQFSRMFEQRQIVKRYQVKVTGDFSKVLTTENPVLRIDDNVDGKTAISDVKQLDFDATNNTSLLEVQIETGRKHQIRRHLLGVGFPVIGDRLYVSDDNSSSEGKEISKANEVEGQSNLDLQLQAKYLEFICPVSAENRVFTL